MNSRKNINGVMISVNPPYSKMIEEQFKPIEFRNLIVKSIQQESNVYIYETKNRRGRGLVVGECTVGRVFSKDEIEKCNIYAEAISRGEDIVIRNGTLLHVLYSFWECKFKTSSLSFVAYVNSIGISGNYAIELTNYISYKEPLCLSSFDTLKGFVVQHPPQNMMNVVRVEDEERAI